ncbi:hypothetical protein [Pseudanabaena sp. BC1403]|uniref:hypothetical protein n=1 Tax=Pseudanabaena sp. BC1403 TaxID=2043171 RepID=UPI000CD96EA7|nr:hypothetical protein [Pseudanabaena sp. BC1403]
MGTIAKTRKPNKQQIALTKPVAKAIAIEELDEDEVEYLLLLMASFKTYSDKAHNSYLKPARIPPISLGKANFFKLRYKLENIVVPKDLIDSI